MHYRKWIFGCLWVCSGILLTGCATFTNGKRLLSFRPVSPSSTHSSLAARQYTWPHNSPSMVGLSVPQTTPTPIYQVRGQNAVSAGQNGRMTTAPYQVYGPPSTYQPSSAPSFNTAAPPVNQYGTYAGPTQDNFAPNYATAGGAPNVPTRGNVAQPNYSGAAILPPPPAPGYLPTRELPPAGSTIGGGPYLESMPPGLPGLGPTPGMTADVDVLVDETQTGRFMFGVGINSDAGVIGNIVVDERNFDLFRPPTSWQDFANGTAFRGGGQGFRLEALPGSRVQRYSVSLTEPYLFGTKVSFNVSGYFFDRRFFDWDEQRLGGRVGFGYRLTPDLSVSSTIRVEQVEIRDPRAVGAAPELDAVVGNHDLYSGRVSLAHDTRDVSFAPTEGHLIEFSYEQAFGSFDYPRGTAEYRQYFRIHERPDTSGRHVLGYTFRVGVSGSDTPVFENFFAGGFSTLRGFDFRGASPVSGGIVVGGRFQFLGSAEYMFPLTADDMLRGVVFVDYGTVEKDIEIIKDNFRVAPGLGLRIFVPAMGPAPIALDFAFPVASAETDDEQLFSFFIGFGR